MSAALIAALRRVASNYRLTLAGKPVRDADECLTNADAAIAATLAPAPIDYTALIAAARAALNVLDATGAQTEANALRAALAAAPEQAKPPLQWAVDGWNSEVKHRPLVNVHRQFLDSAWRKMMRHLGGDPDALVGPPDAPLIGPRIPGQPMEPIAATPAPAPIAQPPLTNEQIEAMWNSKTRFTDYMPPTAFDRYHQGVRESEQAHGIGAQEQKP